MKVSPLILSISLLCAACSSDSGGIGDGRSNDSTLGDDFETYNEIPNNSPQMTNYVLSTEGLKIFGEFSDDSDKEDTYIFNTGEFVSVNVHVFIDGERQYEENSIVTLSLDNLVDDGYSRILGNGYFINAYVAPTDELFQDYTLSISERLEKNVSGRSYVIEIRGEQKALPSNFSRNTFWRALDSALQPGARRS